MKAKLIALILVLTSLEASAEIRDIKSMGEILPAVTQSTAVVFDLDNTVIEPFQTIGSDQFFGYLKGKGQKGGLVEPDLTLWALKAVTPIAPVVPVRSVESITPRLISYLQSHHILTFALTARPPEWAEGTLKQLSSIGVDFSISSPLGSKSVKANNGTLYKGGVIFMAVGNQKGPTLLSFVKSFGLPIGKVVFVDDRLPNNESVEKAFSETEYENINFRYGGADPIVNQFSPSIAETEWQCFKLTGHIISDLQAGAINEGQSICAD